jgi:uncharacterized protein YecE (DUF72 family)
MPAGGSEDTSRTALGPVLRIGSTRVGVGTCSWADPTLVKETDWYPKRTMTSAARLAFYASHFPVVEADSTYYRPPGEQLTRNWARHTPDGFTFNIKAYSLFTHHPTRPEGLWPDLHEAIKPQFRAKPRLYADHLDAEGLDEAWARFARALEPLQEAGRLGAVLMQYPVWFTPKRANRDELASLPGRFPGVRVCVEFRSPRWLAEDDRQRTLALLRQHDLALVVVDAPATSGLDTVAEITSDDLAVVRFHGRADDSWAPRSTSAAERFRYLYDTGELRAWLPTVRRLAAGAREVHLLMNNCYQDYGVRNAGDLQRLLEESDVVIDPPGRTPGRTHERT